MVFLGTITAVEKSKAGSKADSGTAEVRVGGGPSFVPKQRSGQQLWSADIVIS